VNKELRELVNDLCVEFHDTFEKSGGGVPKCIYPLPERSQLQNVMFSEDAHPVFSRNWSGPGDAPNLDKMQNFNVDLAEAQHMM